MTNSGRGGWRGGGRPKKTESEKSKPVKIYLYDPEIPKVKEFVKKLRQE